MCAYYTCSYEEKGVEVESYEKRETEKKKGRKNVSNKSNVATFDMHVYSRKK